MKLRNGTNFNSLSNFNQTVIEIIFFNFLIFKLKNLTFILIINRLEENTKLKERLDADQQSKLTLKFSVKEKSKGSFIEVHQAFVKFTETKSGREIIFLAQAGLTKQYTAEIVNLF